MAKDEGQLMNAMWIAPAGCSGMKNLYFRARGIFELSSSLPEAKLDIAAESLYMVWVNGVFAGAGPARGSRSLNFYDSLEIGQLLRPGRNVISVLVQCMNIPNFVSFPIRGALLAEVEGVTWTGDGSWTLRLADDEWRQDVPIFCVQTGFMEWRDMRKEPKGFFDGSGTEGWAKPEIIGPAATGIAGKRLLPRPVPELAVSWHLPSSISCLVATEPLADMEATNVAETMSTETFLPVRAGLMGEFETLTLGGEHSALVEPPGHRRGVSAIFGFGREIIGFFEMELCAPSGTIVDIAYDEELEDGRLNAARNHYRMADRYILPGGRTKIGTGIHERGFRFVAVSFRNFNSPITIMKVQAKDRRYPVSRRAEFRSSDMLLNKVWDICAETLSTCSTDVFNDCPWRERAFWVNDLIVENLAWLQAFGDSRLNAHALRLALSNVRKDGWLPGVCPDSDNPNIVLVPTNLYIPLMLKDYLLHSGDLELVRELLPAALKLIALFDACLDENGVVNPPDGLWNFFDWSYELNKVSLNGKRSSLLEWLRCLALSDAAWLSEKLGDSGQAKALREKIPAVVKGAMKSFWTEGSARCADWIEKDGTPSGDSSQLTHAFALLSGALPEERKSAAIEALDDHEIRVPELYLHHFVFQAMRDAGMAQAAIDRIKLHWGKMAESGTPTLWEAAIHEHGKKAYWNAGSLCHGFGSSPIGVLQSIILGVRPVEAGFSVFSFSPNACGLRFASGSVPTPSGEIRVEWKVDGTALKAKINIPESLVAFTPDGRRFGCGQHEIEFK